LKIGPISLLATLLTLLAPLLTQSLLPASAYVTTDQYIARNIEGWEEELDKYDPKTARLLRSLWH
jgi:hypothetical protein